MNVLILENVSRLLKGREKVLNGFVGKIFPIVKQMFQSLSIALAQVKAGNTFKSLLSEIGQIIYSLYRVKKLLKKYITT